KVLGRLLTDQMSQVQEIANEIKSKEVEYIFLAARGTSDNAGLYAKYLWGAYNHVPIALATPSLFSIYDKPPDLKKALIVGISQSGKSPDIVRVIEEGSRQNVPTLVITNDTASPLAESANYVLSLNTGPETAVAATKTYTAQLMLIAMLSVALEGDQERKEDLNGVQDWVASMLGFDTMISQLAEQYRDMRQCVVLGRGYNYATAFEWALKLKELTYTMAGAYSSADFQHGPLALVTKGFPVFAVAPSGMVYPELLSLLERLRHVSEVDLFVISNEDEALRLAQSAVSIPSDLPEWLSPIVCVIPAQLTCLHISRVKGIDTENPRGLEKVTLTW
ncbi:MAG: SIS domain-containing protein, partial [Anaerolineales bacterium]